MSEKKLSEQMASEHCPYADDVADLETKLVFMQKMMEASVSQLEIVTLSPFNIWRIRETAAIVLNQLQTCLHKYRK